MTGSRDLVRKGSATGSGLDRRLCVLCASDVDGTVDLGERTPLPVACTLGPEDGETRLRRWQQLNQRAAPVSTLHGHQLEVRYRAEPGVAEELAALAAAEQSCCSFVTWSVAVIEDQPVLRVTAPPEAPEAVEPIAAMFGVATS